MKTINYFIIIFISLLAVSCSKITDPVKKIGLGTRVVSYQSDENLDSLIIPPNLTEAVFTGAFTEIIENSNDEIGTKKIQNIEVMRDNYRRWLVVDMLPSQVWSLSKEFFRSYNFKIEKENQIIGIFETDYLEIETLVPDKSLGVIRASLSKVLQTQYGLPIADKYRVRIETIENQNKSEVYLTLSSIGEVVSGATRVWQPRDKDIALETEMLLKLMVFLGSERDEAVEKIQTNITNNQAIIRVETSESGYASLLFPYDKKQSWSYLGWALDIDIEDRDPIEGSYFIKATPSSGFFSRILSSVSKAKTYQLIIKEVDELTTYIYFVDLSEENEVETVNYSSKLFNEIAAKF